MKVLLTGANGFLGSHILDSLLSHHIETAVLLRPTANREFIKHHLQQTDIRIGSLNNGEDLDAALRNITHVIHCAGCTKALRTADFYTVNQQGTRNLAAAVNRQQGRIKRFIHISSLAAGGPATPANPARENLPPRPVSEYGRSKLGAEMELQNSCKAELVILRPPAVYGPRDDAFLPLFKAVKAHVLPLLGNGRLPLSLVFVRDLAETVVTSLAHPAAAGKIFYAASTEVTSPRTFARTIAAQLQTWAIPVPLPTPVLWPVCCLREAVSLMTRKPAVLSRQKYAELRAPGWVCDPARLRQELGVQCATTIQQGITETLYWYRQQGWL